MRELRVNEGRICLCNCYNGTQVSHYFDIDATSSPAQIVSEGLHIEQQHLISGGCYGTAPMMVSAYRAIVLRLRAQKEGC